MNRINRLAATILVCTLAMTATHTAVANTPAHRETYICPPCGCASDGKPFEKPGQCPDCGMRLVAQQITRKVAILLWDGVELLDFSGPGEVFAAARMDGAPAYEVFTVAATTKPILSQGFVTITPTYTLQDCPAPDVLVIPGGGAGVPMRDQATMQWVKKAATEAEITLSVCTGAFVLAKAGLLDGKQATTHHGAIAAFRTAAPNTTVLTEQRYVDNGNIITAAGVSAGIDAALHVVRKLQGESCARNTARYMEYEWKELDGRKEPNRPRTQVAPTIDAVKAALQAGQLDATTALTDPAFLPLHEQRAFRLLIRKHPARGTTRLTTSDEPGTPLSVSGQILDTSGTPIEGALVYVYHTDDTGSYSSTGGNFGDQGDALNPRLFAWLITGPDGRYRFDTIRPGHYPNDGPPSHIHYEIVRRGFRKLVTEVMFDNDAKMSADTKAWATRQGFVVADVHTLHDGRQVCRADMTMQRVGEN